MRPENCALVLDKHDGSGTVLNVPKIKILSGNGAKTIYTVETSCNIGDLIYYDLTLSSNGDLPILGKGKTATLGYDSETKMLGDMRTAEDCVLFMEYTPAKAGDIYGNPSYMVSPIRELKTIPAQPASYIIDPDCGVIAVFMDLETTPKKLVADTVYGVVSEELTPSGNGNCYVVQSNQWRYPVTLRDGTLQVGDLVRFTETDDDIYTRDAITVFAEGAVGDLAVRAVYLEGGSKLDAEQIKVTYYTDVRSEVYSTLENPLTRYVGVEESKASMVFPRNRVIGINRRSNTSSQASIEPFDDKTGYKNALIITRKDERGNTTGVAIFTEESGTCHIIP